MATNGAHPVKAQTPNNPNQTLYVSNLQDKLNKADLKRALYMIFSAYGPVLDVIALKTTKMRGQAHICYRDINTATQAMRALQGFDFFGKEMRIAYGRGKSDIVSRLDGTAKIPEPMKEQSTATELQKSVFAAPPASTSTQPTVTGTLKPPDGSVQDGAKSPQGLKRPREDESDAEDASMEEDDDEDAEMEESDED